ncbi:MAG: YceI family protein [Gemmatimonadetes bacterium]|nr:YceI family protein [Gemmatimonadota bacterium]
MHALLAALLLFLPVTPPQAKAWTVDRAHSEINFSAEARFLSAHGYFGAWEAEVRFVPEDVPASTVKITIDVKSITTRNDRRDNHLKSNDFFAADSFPTITFVSRRIAAAGDDRWEITGDLTMRGVTREIVVPTQLAFAEGNRRRFKGTFTLNRMPFGVKYLGTINRVSEEVEVQFQISILEPPR